eukprot:TRINITY_DN5181_c0_g1_i1.p1 TRINITY_DN5181_c0_g1~~TRINITY_DN5181_c0_g1_i1.p1  ORF type:complete len:143 (+),score=31.74 TRINITY_DN5181_c0_g1_i1:49-477(+)
MIKFLIIANKEGQTRLSQYYEQLSIEERTTLEASLVRLCMSRTELQCSIVEYMNYKLVYRRYASLFFVVGIDQHENELSVLEFVHCYVETLDQYFENVCELDIVMHIDKAHIILDEMLVNGHIVETNKTNVLNLLRFYDTEK